MDRTTFGLQKFLEFEHEHLLSLHFTCPPGNKGLPMYWQRALPTVRRSGKKTFATVVKNPQQIVYEEIIQGCFNAKVSQYWDLFKQKGIELPYMGPIGLYTLGQYLSPKTGDWWRDPLIPPDLDNVWKLVSDALQKVAYQNDQQIVHSACKKVEVENNPGTQVAIVFFAQAVKPEVRILMTGY